MSDAIANTETIKSEIRDQRYRLRARLHVSNLSYVKINLGISM